MASFTRREVYSHIRLQFVLGFLLSLITFVTTQAQTVTYRLHKEASTTPSHLQLKAATPDAAIFAVQSANLKNAAIGEYLIQQFDTQSQVPNASGIITAGSTISVDVWMRKTATAGTMFPRVKINLNSSGGASLGVITGTTQLSTTITKYTLTGTVPANVTMGTNDRFYLWVGVNLTAKTTQNNNAELNIEGTQNGNYDSQITVPLPTAPPVISSLTPNAATIGSVITITGTGFGANRGTSTVTFNQSRLATVTAWSDTSISVMVPVFALTGSVVVNVSGLASNGSSFTVNPKINNITDTFGTYVASAITGSQLTINGSGFGSTKGTSTITFNGVTAATTIWNDGGITATVPAGANTGPVVVTVNGHASNTPIFNVIPHVDSVTPGAATVGGAVTIAGSGFGSAQGSSTVNFNGIASTPTSWSTTSISAPLPPAATGPVVITVNGLPSNSATFTATPKIDSVTPNIGGAATPVTVVGSSFGVTPGSSTITFNGVAAKPTTWTDTSISVLPPAGVTTGAVVVTVNAVASNGVNFSVSTTGSLAGTITQTGNAAPINGAVIEALQGGVLQSSSTSGANGSYNISTLNTGTYDLRVSAVGYEATTQTGVVVSPNTTTTVDKSLAVDSPSEISYVHDELGRLAGVVTASEKVSYAYDDVGNLLSISRGSSAIVSIIEFTPNSGGAGAEVTIFGTGFSATPSQNAVTFNGVAATVTSVGKTHIVTNVPAGATTGPISVTTPLGTGVSNTAFVIGSLAPTISSFNPTTGTTGTAVVISGTNFDPTFYNNKTKFNLAASAVTAGTTSSLNTTVPSTAASGRITVMAPEAAVVSTDDFFVAPPGHAASEILVTGRMSIGDVVPITIGTGGKIAMLVFEGIAGRRVTLGVSGVTLGSPCCTNVAAAAIYKPDGTELLSPTGFLQEGWGSPVLQLPVTGTYAVMIDPADQLTGNATVTVAEELVGPISINGPTVPVNINRPGQNARLTFSGTAGQRINLGLSGITLGNPCCTPVGATAIYKPDGTALLVPTGFMQEGWGSPVLQLPVTGTYEITIDAALTLMGNVTVTLSEELAVPISTTGPPVPLIFNRPGQDARLTFSGTAGQRVTLGLSGITIGSPCCSPVGAAAIYNPDGTTLLSPTSFLGEGWGSQVLQLPATGQYAITIDPGLGNMTVTLSDEWVIPISVDGAALPLNFARAGQNARLTFDGTAGQRVSFGIKDVTIGNTCCGVVAGVAIYKPDGTALVSSVGLEPNIGLGTAPLDLPVTGTYAITIDPAKAFTGNVTAALSGELTTTIAINGPAVPLDFNRVGRNARLSFTGNAGQLVSVAVTDVTLTNGCCSNAGTVGISKPDGTALRSPTNFISSYGSATFVLPVTGTYTVPVDPAGMNTGNAAVWLSEDVLAPITINGPTVPITTSRPGQNASLTFNGTSGALVTVRITGNSFGNITVNVIKPDGTTLTSQSGSFTFNLTQQTLPATGAYRINIHSNSSLTGNVTVGVTTP